MPEAARELDVRAIPPPQRHPEIFRSFDGLGPGEAFVLVNDHDPKPLLYQFQVERAGRFNWSVLEQGPERYRIAIHRREETPRGVTEYLEWDHRRLDGIFAEVEQRVGAAAFGDAGRKFAEFACGLNHHIDMEERVLFPAFEEMTGMAGGPTTVMRMEHVEIRQALRDIATAIDGQDASGFRDGAATLFRVLGEHNMKEERILYPTTDAHSGSDRARDDLVRKLQAL